MALFDISVVCDVFQLSDSIGRDLAEMYKSYGPDGKFTHYVGLQDNEIVATGTTYIDGKVVGLYNGATLAKVQKSGFCTALIQAAIKDAIKLNCEYAIAQLMTPGMAKGLTQKMGFKQYCNLLPYLKDPRVTIS